MEKLLRILKSSLSELNLKTFVALDSYDVLDKINSSESSDIVIIDVGNEDSLGDYPEVGVCSETFEIYIARCFGLSEITDCDFFRRCPESKALWELRNAVRDKIRAVKFDNSERIFETDYFKYMGAKRFETPFNLRASVFVLTFTITATLPQIQ